MTKPKFAFFGMGNLGLAHAGHMALHGYDVSLCNRTGAKLQLLIENNNEIRLGGILAEKARLTLVTASYEEAIAGRDVIVICTAAPGHKYTVTQLLPFLRPHHHIVLHPGYMLGAVEIHQLLTKHQLDRIPISEIESSLFTCRYDGSVVHIKAMKKHLGFATLPGHRNRESLSLFHPLYSQYLRPYSNVMETGMLNLNFINHPPIALLNAAVIDTGKRFLYYREGVTEHVANLIEATDNERIAICHALGIQTVSAHEWQQRHYPGLIGDDSTLCSTLKTNAAYHGVYSPDKLYSRFIWEDIPYGIIPVISIGSAIGVKTPSMDAIYGLCKAMFHADWSREARTLDNLGLRGLNGRQLLRFMVIGNTQSIDSQE
uniref:2-dehydropantoate 2-reductase n=1 Tax=Candidatus Kentrum sp. MB TaxID=2138164 RepID=A0A450XXW6_9GAMM|nr:MAG: opine dehydrogenase [Candidatus Kentron sp. MB]VFK34095.1 MAG: opine dehydrogenase [Candidatus Kentron sp. MB]VFK76736.1 MAG: opine dehydrogenase [Candidatus Kentron sp. MB]